MGLTFIFITHDLSVVNHFADEIAVMYLGQLIEKAPTEELFDHPVHPYTEGASSAIPIPEVGIKRPERILLKGEISSPIDPPEECRFAKRCTYTCSQCHESCPKLLGGIRGTFCGLPTYGRTFVPEKTGKNSAFSRMMREQEEKHVSGIG